MHILRPPLYKMLARFVQKPIRFCFFQTVTNPFDSRRNLAPAERAKIAAIDGPSNNEIEGRGVSATKRF